jgi:anti-anti-sigma factor
MSTTPAQPWLHIRLTELPNVTVLTVLDSQLNDDLQVMDLRDELLAALGQSAHKGLVIDMKNVAYMTSIALMALVALRKAAESSGHRVALCNLADIVAKVLTISQLIVESRPHVRHLAMAQDLESAIKLVAVENA